MCTAFLLTFDFIPSFDKTGPVTHSLCNWWINSIVNPICKLANKTRQSGLANLFYEFPPVVCGYQKSATKPFTGYMGGSFPVLSWKWQVLWVFGVNWNSRLFMSAFPFRTTWTDGSLILLSFKETETTAYYQNQIPAQHWFPQQNVRSTEILIPWEVAHVIYHD